MNAGWILETPPSAHVARDYAADVVFHRWLGLELSIHRVDRPDLRLRREGSAGSLTLPEVIAINGAPPVLEPHPPPAWLRSPGPDVPVIPRACSPAPTEFGKQMFQGDLLGTVFYWLSGWGEFASTLRDAHERIPAASLGVSAASRPIADELAGWIRAAILQVWPDTSFPPAARPLVAPSHDVDQPDLLASLSAAQIFRASRRQLYPELRPIAALESGVRWSLARLGMRSADPFHTFPWLMRQSEKRGLRSTFYFQAGRTDPRFDHAPDIALPAMRRLLRSIHARGHRIGLHPSYRTFRDGEALKREYARLREVCAEEKIFQENWPCRMHYLRWDVRLTPGLLDEAGLDEDSSLAFADRAGFRRGTARAFPLWCWTKKRPLRILEQPLVAMEASLLAPDYENLPHREARDRLRRLRAACREHGGTFTLLWHNSSLRSPEDRELYLDAIAASAE
jgi:hypothetical protein